MLVVAAAAVLLAAAAAAAVSITAAVASVATALCGALTLVLFLELPLVVAPSELEFHRLYPSSCAGGEGKFQGERKVSLGYAQIARLTSQDARV